MLEGIRIIEVEGLGPAPFASMLLADLGADVIVVHRPVSGTGGDESASTNRSHPSDLSKKPAATLSKPVLDRGKRSITLNLKDADDVEIFKQLVDSADALIEGFRPGVMERLGLGPSVCMATNKRLVYGRMTGWGQDGSKCSMAGHDLNYVGLSGAAWHAANDGRAPFPPPTLVGDIGGGAMYLVVGILSGLLNAQKTGKGTVVDAAIVDGSAHMMNLLMSLQQGGESSAKLGTGLLECSHFSRCYLTGDDNYVSVQCLEPAFYAVFLDKLGLSDNTDFQNQYDQSRWPELITRLESLFATRSRAEWELLFADSDACVAPVLHPDEALTHEANQHRQVWMKHQGVMQSSPAPRFSTGKSWTPVNSPVRDEHRQAILDELMD